MPKDTLWSAIRDQLMTDLAQGAYAPGQKLPSEAELSKRFGVNRHTLRRALHNLVEQDLVTSRRGAGFFVAAAPADYSLGRQPQFTRDVSQSGRLAEKRADRIEVRDATPTEQAELQTDRVIVYEGTGLIDQQKLSWFSSRFDAHRFPELPKLLQNNPSLTQAWKDLEVVGVHRARTQIQAVTADSLLAQRLDVKSGSALLAMTSLDADGEGVAVEWGETWFVGQRMTLTLT